MWTVLVDQFPNEDAQDLQPEGHRWRRIISLLWLVAIASLVLVFVVAKRHELSDIGDVLLAADRRWIAVAGVIELTILILMTKTYQSILASLGQRLPLHSIMSSYLKALAIGTVVPFGGPAAMIVFIRSLTRLGVPANDAVFASTLASLSGFASFLLVLLSVLAALFITGQLPTVVVGATLALAVVFLVAASAVIIPLRWKRIPSWITRYLPETVGKFLERAHSHHIHLNDLRRPFLYSFGVDLCGGAMLYASLISVGQASQILAAFAGYQVEMLFNVITPLFQGIGIADLSITVALSQLGVTLSEAAAATLVYRLWDLWVPLLIGAILYSASRGNGARSS